MVKTTSNAKLDEFGKTFVSNNQIYNKDKKFLGKVIGETYYTTRKPNHFMRIYNGFGLSISVLRMLHSNGIDKISITYEEGSKTRYFMTTTMKFLSSDREWKYHTEDGIDLQKFLSLKEMEEINGFS